MPQALDILVYHRLFLDVRIGDRHVGFRLVEIVVRNEIVYRRVGEEIAIFGSELGGERLVVRDDERRALYLLYDIGDGEGLAGARDAEKGLVTFPRLEPLHKRLYRRRLVACGLVIAL